MSLDLTVHHLTVDRETSIAALTRVTPYIRIRGSESPPLFLKAGRITSEDGKEVKIEDAPAWCIIEMKKLTKRAIEECGFDGDAVQNLSVEEGEEQPDVKAKPPGGRRSRHG